MVQVQFSRACGVALRVRTSRPSGGHRRVRAGPGREALTRRLAGWGNTQVVRPGTCQPHRPIAHRAGSARCTVGIRDTIVVPAGHGVQEPWSARRIGWSVQASSGRPPGPPWSPGPLMRSPDAGGGTTVMGRGGVHASESAGAPTVQVKVLGATSASHAPLVPLMKRLAHWYRVSTGITTLAVSPRHRVVAGRGHSPPAAVAR